jgi:DNA-binding HxlR family transcriptional regulator
MNLIRTPYKPLGFKELNLQSSNHLSFETSKTRLVSLRSTGGAASVVSKATSSSLGEGFYPVTFGHLKNHLIFPAPHLIPQAVLETTIQLSDTKISLIEILKVASKIDNGNKVNGSEINNSLSLHIHGKPLDFLGETLEFLGDLGFLEVEKPYHVIWLKDWRMTKEGRKKVSSWQKTSPTITTKPAPPLSSGTSSSWLQLTTDPSVISESASGIEALIKNVYSQILIIQTHQKLLDFQTLETPLSEDVTNLTLLKTLQTLQQKRYRWSRWIRPGISEGALRSKFRGIPPETLHQALLTLQSTGFISQSNASSSPHPQWALTPKSSTLLASLPMIPALALDPVGVSLLLKKALTQLQTKQKQHERLVDSAKTIYQKASLTSDEAQSLWERLCQEAVSFYDQEVKNLDLKSPTPSLQEKLFKANHQELILETALQEKNHSAAEYQKELAHFHRFLITSQKSTLEIQKALLHLNHLPSLREVFNPFSEDSFACLTSRSLPPQEEESFHGILKSLLSLDTSNSSVTPSPILPPITEPPIDPALALQKEIQRLRLLQKTGAL